MATTQWVSLHISGAMFEEYHSYVSRDFHVSVLYLFLE